MAHRYSGNRYPTAYDTHQMLRGLIVATPMSLVSWALIIVAIRGL